jgi:UDP-N-acetylmuramoyl-L-alanyl-D-glutamate--2,6-diaminopimelate ligase
LFRSLPAASVAVVNDDSPYASRLTSLTRARVVTFGSTQRADYRLGPVHSSFEGVRFDLMFDGRSVPVRSPLPGLPNASNVAAAMATALALGIPEEAVLAGVRSCTGAPGRFERIARGQDFHVIVDYAHTDDAIARVLEAVRALHPARILTVFGCGGDRDRIKRPLMGAAAARGSDEVILTSDNPRTEDPERIMDDAEAGVRSVPGAIERMRRIADRREAIAAAIALAQTGDAVVIAGKGHEDYQILGDRTVPFDDRRVATECLDLRLGRG